MGIVLLYGTLEVKGHVRVILGHSLNMSRRLLSTHCSYEAVLKLAKFE